MRHDKLAGLEDCLGWLDAIRGRLHALGYDYQLPEMDPLRDWLCAEVELWERVEKVVYLEDHRNQKGAKT